MTSRIELPADIEEHRDVWWCREGGRQVESAYAAERFIEPLREARLDFLLDERVQLLSGVDAKREDQALLPALPAFDDFTHHAAKLGVPCVASAGVVGPVTDELLEQLDVRAPA